VGILKPEGSEPEMFRAGVRGSRMKPTETLSKWDFSVVGDPLSVTGEGAVRDET